jgi:hypothetical protein
MKVYPSNVSCARNWISMFFYYIHSVFYVIIKYYRKHSYFKIMLVIKYAYICGISRMHLVVIYATLQWKY